MSRIFKIRSTISPALMRYSVLKGTLIASLGGILLVYCGGFVSPKVLGVFGIFIWTTGISLIAYGLIPYKSLLELSTKPNELIFDDRDQMHYMCRSKHQFVIPTRSIQSVEFLEGLLNYGLVLRVRNEEGGEKKIFLPYFSHRSYEKVKEALNPHFSQNLG